MIFGIVDPRPRIFDYVEADDVTAVYPRAGLERARVDHSVVGRLAAGGGAVMVIASEFGFYEPADRQAYCLIGSRLIAGACVLYQCDERGETVDLDRRLIIKPLWCDAAAVERAIASGIARRPSLVINGDLIWQWPQPAPPDMVRR